MCMSSFHVASSEEIKRCGTTDVYFVRAKRILENIGLEKTKVVAEVTLGHFPENWAWGILCGIEELATLLEKTPIDVYSMPEGTAFYPSGHRGFRVPIVRIEGAYRDFCLYETPLLGVLCQATGIATRAARMRIVAEDKRLISFGIRRMHPALSPMIDRAAFIGGFDAVSCIAGARATDTKPVGTMPHALIIVIGDQVKAWKTFDSEIQKEIPRVALIDTYSDEKTEALMAINAVKDLDAVRLDTPSSRKGDFLEVVREVRWELDLRGCKHVKIFVSGGLDEKSVKQLSEAGADAFGVGTYVSNSPTVNFALDIVEKEGKPCAKRGKLGGRKEVWRCPTCMIDLVLPYVNSPPICPRCKHRMERMLKPLIKKGRVVRRLLRPKEIRKNVLRQLEKLCVE